MSAEEEARRDLQTIVNSEAAERTALEGKYGQVWNTQETQEDFEVLGFVAPYVMVKRKSDGKKGSLMFQHLPRYYWGFCLDSAT